MSRNDENSDNFKPADILKFIYPIINMAHTVWAIRIEKG